MKNFILAVLAAFFVFGLSACGSKEEPNGQISALETPSWCQPDIEKGVVVIIDNEASCKKAFENCQFMPKVDFKNKNLLLVKDVAANGIHDINSDIIEDNGRYKLNISVGLTFTEVMEPWCVAYTVPKNLNEDNVLLNISYDK